MMLFCSATSVPSSELGLPVSDHYRYSKVGLWTPSYQAAAKLDIYAHNSLYGFAVPSLHLCSDAYCMAAKCNGQPFCFRKCLSSRFMG